MQTVSCRLAALLLLVSAGSAPGLGQAPQGTASALLRLKSGNHYASAGTADSITLRGGAGQSAHFIAIFQTIPDARDAQNLRDLGYDVFSFVPDNGLLVYGNPAADLSALGVVENYSLQVKDKLSARLDSASAAALTVVVEMQPDADLGLVLLRLLMAGSTLLPNQDLDATEFLVQAPYATLQTAASWDDIAYIYPASPQMTSGQKVMPCAMGYSEGTGLGVAANLVPTFGDGWAGAAPGPTKGSAALSYDLHTAALPLAESDVRGALQAVLAEWGSHAAITFTPTTQANANASIDISFPSGDHGDGFPFTPSGAVLAHTFYPPPNPETIAGDMHVNYDEAWSVNGSLQLYPVMLHEMGHALGLGHSDDPGDVMYPYYQAKQHLASGDIQALLTLYAAPTQTVTPAPTPTPTPTPSDPVLPYIPVTPTTPGTPTTPATTPGTPATGDTIPPLIQVYSPSMAATLTYEDSLTIEGFATDNVGVTRISWSNSAGGSGSTSVASPFVISGIALVPGVNRIWIQASDAAGNVGSAYLSVTKR
jgi:hypothetical protein